jgi:hypothetical protein
MEELRMTLFLPDVTVEGRRSLFGDVVTRGWMLLNRSEDHEALFCHVVMPPEWRDREQGDVQALVDEAGGGKVVLFTAPVPNAA